MASGKKRRKGRQEAKPRSSQGIGYGGELGSVGERDATLAWARGQQPAGYTAPDSGLPDQLPSSLRDLSPDDDVSVTIVTGGTEPPPGTGELIGTLTRPGRLSDGTVIEAGARIYRSLRDLAREEIAADPRSVTLTIGDFAGIDFGEEPGETVAALPARSRPLARQDKPGVIDVPGAPDLGQVRGTLDLGKPAPLGESRTATGETLADLDYARHHDAQGPGRIAAELGWPDPGKVPAGFRRGGPAIPAKFAPVANAEIARSGRGPAQLHSVPEGVLPEEALRRLEAASPGLAAKLAAGLSPDELGESAGQIAAALHQAGAGPGTYTFSDRSPGTNASAITGGKRNDGGPGLPYGMQPGDIIAAGQPAGYELAGIDLPEGTAGAGERVWRPARTGQHAVIGDRPQIVVTDDLDSVPDDDGEALVIEDLDGDDDDAGRLLVGDRDQVRRYHELVRELDRRSQALIAGPSEHALIRDAAAAGQVRLRTSWTGDYVLNMRSWLAHHYQHPNPDLADYLARLMRDAVNQDFRSAHMYWPVNLESGPAGRPEGMQLARLIARGVEESAGCQVTAAMCEKLRSDWDADPGDPLPLDEGELPAPEGFAWLDRPWLIRETAGYWLPVRAVSWEKTVILAAGNAVGSPDRAISADAARIVLWLLTEDDVAFGRWEPVPSRADRVANRIGRLVPFHVMTMPFGLRFRVSSGHTSLSGAFGLIHTLWKTLGEILPKSRPVRAVSPVTARRAARSLKYDELHIITLRQYEYIGETGPHFPGKPDWRGRWWVDEFCRHIDHYDDGTDDKGRRRRHQATPANRTGYVTDDDHDICAVCLANGHAIRIALVRTYAKGPAGKPFLKPAKERTLLRLSR
jgi:hypothetical protein